jgi:hypothetical protein
MPKPKPRARVVTCTCEVCKNPFLATRRDARFCKDAHRMKYYRTQKILRENRPDIDPCVEIMEYYNQLAQSGH